MLPAWARARVGACGKKDGHRQRGRCRQAPCYWHPGEGPCSDGGDRLCRGLCLLYTLTHPTLRHVSRWGGPYRPCGLNRGEGGGGEGQVVVQGT
jgi:hypothetical protein